MSLNCRQHSEELHRPLALECPDLKFLSSGSDVGSPRIDRGQTLDGNKAALEADCQHFRDQQAVLDVVPFEFGQVVRHYHGRVLQNIELRVTVGAYLPDERER